MRETSARVTIKMLRDAEYQRFKISNLKFFIKLCILYNKIYINYFYVKNNKLYKI